MNNSARLKGFTLIELLIAIGLIAVLSVAIIPSFNSYIKNQNLRQSQEQIKSDLRTAQNSALTGENKGVSPSIVYWGVRFTPNSDKYEFINSFNTSPVCGEGSEAVIRNSSSLPGDVVVRNTSVSCVYFDFSEGGSPYSQTIYVGKPSDSECFTVAVNSVGLVTLGNATCPI